MAGRTILGGAYVVAVGALTGFVLSEVRVPAGYSALSGGVLALGLACFLQFYGKSRA